ncbi:MAG: T9SS type A sorting domain-containing protein [Bacteroidetes bacterium]|nr:T9SS type A sorting domain-containing protein [Bacteroidota bacterium]
MEFRRNNPRYFGKKTRELYAKDKNGCISPLSSPIQVTVWALPQAPLIIPKDSAAFCKGDSIMVKASGGNQYLWNTGLKTNSFYTKNSGTFSAKCADKNGCWSKNESKVFIKENAVPDTPAIIQDKLILYSSIKANVYLWYLDGALLKDTGFTITPTKEGKYQVKIFNGYCYSTLSKEVDFKFPKKEFQWRLYPNPFVDNLTLEIRNTESDKVVNIVFYDLVGKKLRGEKIISLVNSTTNNSYFMDGIESGVYIVKITIDGDTNFSLVKVLKSK